MERYKVYWGNGTSDFAIIYAHSETEAINKFQEYQPDKTVLIVIPFPKLPDLLTLYEQNDFSDEHEYLLAVIEAVQDAGVEDKVVQCLLDKGWGR